MITPNFLEEIASYVEQDGKKVFVFSADCCGTTVRLVLHQVMPLQPIGTLLSRMEQDSKLAFISIEYASAVMVRQRYRKLRN